MRIWSSKIFAKKNGLVLEEWLTVTRQKIYLKCKELKVKGLIKDVVTKQGDVYAVVAIKDSPPAAGEVEKILVVTDTQFEQLLKRTKGVLDEEGEEDLGVSKEDEDTESRTLPS